jgi:hypothetical protein
MNKRYGVELVILKRFKLCGDGFAPGDTIRVHYKLAETMIANGQAVRPRQKEWTGGAMV